MTFEAYQASLEADYRRGNATEHTYRGTLKALLESQFPGIVATNEPKRIKAGAPVSEFAALRAGHRQREPGGGAGQARCAGDGGLR